MLAFYVLIIIGIVRFIRSKNKQEKQLKNIENKIDLLMDQIKKDKN
ncbi:DUF4083 domain-containing protein [Peribacillus sp. SCS-155]